MEPSRASATLTQKMRLVLWHSSGTWPTMQGLPLMVQARVALSHASCTQSSSRVHEQKACTADSLPGMHCAVQVFVFGLQTEPMSGGVAASQSSLTMPGLPSLGA